MLYIKHTHATAHRSCNKTASEVKMSRPEIHFNIMFESVHYCVMWLLPPFIWMLKKQITAEISESATYHMFLRLFYTVLTGKNRQM